MGFITDAVGLSGNNNFQTKNTGPVTQGQIDKSYATTQSGLDQQQAFISALHAQNGIQNQTNAYNQLQGLANGTGPNPALAQLNQQTANNAAQQAALQAGQRGAGANVGLLARNIANQGANLQQQNVGQAATLQAQQQANAINQMGGLATQQVGQQQQALQGYNQAAQGQQGNLLSAFGNNEALKAQAEGQNAAAKSEAVGGLLKGGAGALMSDERQKMNIHNGDAQVKDFLDNMGAHAYQYKDPTLPGTSPGEHVSPMAQELEKSQMGSELVHDTPNGKMIDSNASIGALLAANAHLNKRLEAMEQKYAQGGMVKDGRVAQQDVDNENVRKAKDLHDQSGRVTQQDVQHFDEGGQVKAPVSKAGWAAFQSGFNGKPAPQQDQSQDANKKEKYAMGGSVERIAAPSIPQAAKLDLGPMPSGAGSSKPQSTGQLNQDSSANLGVTPQTTDPFGVNGGGTQLAAPGAVSLMGRAPSNSFALGANTAMSMPSVPMMAQGGQVQSGPRSHIGRMYKAGGKVSGKAQVAGNSPKNDTVDAKLSPGEVVIPRSVMNGNDPVRGSADFVAAILNKKSRSTPAKSKKK